MHWAFGGGARCNHHLDETLNRLFDAFLSNHESSSHDNHYRDNDEGGQQVMSPKTTKLEFLHFSRDDPTWWFSCVTQFFEYQGTTEYRRFSWPLITRKGRQINDANGSAKLFRMKDMWSHGRNLKRSFGLTSDPYNVRTLMRPSYGLGKWGLWGITSSTLKDSKIKFEGGLERHY